MQTRTWQIKTNKQISPMRATIVFGHNIPNYLQKFFEFELHYIISFHVY